MNTDKKKSKHTKRDYGDVRQLTESKSCFTSSNSRRKVIRSRSQPGLLNGDDKRIGDCGKLVKLSFIECEKILELVRVPPRSS